MRHLCALLVFGAASLPLSGQGQISGEPSWQEAVQTANDAQSKGRSAEAELLIQNAWANVRRAGPADEYFPAGVQAVANFYVAAGFGLKADGILHAAEAAAAGLPSQHINRLSILALKAQTYSGQGRAIEAQVIFEQLLPLQVKHFGQDPFDVRNTLQTLASSYDSSGELEKAEA